MLLFGYLLSSWKIDRLSENSRKREEELRQEGFTVMLDNARATGSVITIGETIYVQMAGDVTLICEDTRTQLVIAREVSFPFRENKNLHDEAVDITSHEQSDVLPDARNIAWDVELDKLMEEIKKPN
ncbi:MAG: hypothetical protein G01um101448_1063 [Parcubacteria group bacterium Gr01-1014_48]|nr:MAG: hypothetical protein Greene041614_620 [Parcubacteria group bacterium Greene0416_14]TSC71997.1 MAG: hypothetical protein G01um101448_1063 [Parcubacteria group bacterium Gr01-1014_48]TSD00868.1 MAG: hypothetical protein Greene101415_669 [Parcubacteria group bacterium Greene1014_15]TSD07950.1 MAG: hypothetical protein Greene07144_580 [Parcubacteria group bacterium Greene0714_4]